MTLIYHYVEDQSLKNIFWKRAFLLDFTSRLCFSKYTVIHCRSHLRNDNIEIYTNEIDLSLCREPESEELIQEIWT